MKKLFSTLLAATMVAGTAVSAFAAVSTSYTAADTSDYTLATVVLDKNGKTVTDVEGGDKLYYPILISKGQLDKTGYNDAYYLMNLASELDGLTARVKNVRNGKYLKDPAIVRKDVAGLYATNVTVPAGTPTVGNAEVVTAQGEFKVVLDSTTEMGVTGGETTKKVTLKIGSLAPVDSATLDVSSDKKDANAIAAAFNGKTVTVNGVVYTATVAERTITFKAPADTDTVPPVDGTSVVVTSDATVNTVVNVTTSSAKEGKKAVVAKAGKFVTGVIPALKEKTKVNLTFNGKNVSIVATGTLATDLAAFATEYNKKDTVDFEAKVNGTDKLEFNQRAGKESNAALPTDFALSTGLVAGDSKVYCVEVALGDYFGNEQKELEFDIELRHKGRLEFTTKDAKNGPSTYFNLGSEAKELVAGKSIGDDAKRGKVKKFRNGDLELEITADTGSVKLDEAKLVDGVTKEDVDNIYLEGKDVPVTFDVKASGQGDLYLSVDKDANKKVVIANQEAKMTFVNFPGKPEFDFTGIAKFTVEDPDVNYYFYEIVDNKPVKTNAKYNKEDECFELRTRTLGSYVISDKELEAADTTEKPSTDKPTDKPSEEKPGNPTTPDKNVPTGAIA